MTNTAATIAPQNLTLGSFGAGDPVIHAWVPIRKTSTYERICDGKLTTGYRVVGPTEHIRTAPASERCSACGA